MLKNQITANQILKAIKKGGATINKNGNFAKYLKNGFMCSICDCSILSITELKNIVKTANQILKTLKKGEYLGLWVENGFIYIDISKKFFSREFALIYGKIYNQKSIFDLTTKNCIYL